MQSVHKILVGIIVPLVLLIGSPALAVDCPTELMSLGMSGPLATYVCKGKLMSAADLPDICEVGEMFLDTNDDACTDANDGDGAVCVCEAVNTWALIKDI